MREVEVIGDDDESVQNCMKAIREKIEGGRRDGGDRPPRGMLHILDLMKICRP